jgi:hypothetical protein
MGGSCSCQLRKLADSHVELISRSAEPPLNAAIFSAGIACLIAAVVGGGMKGLGLEIPVIQSGKRQSALAIVGLILMMIGLFQQRIEALGDKGEKQAGSEHSDLGVNSAGKPSLGKNVTPASSTPASTSSSKNEADKSQLQSQSKTSEPAHPSETVQMEFEQNTADYWVDRETGLLWPRVAKMFVDFPTNVQDDCQGLNIGGRSSWLAPRLNQVKNLYERRPTEIQIDSRYVAVQDEPDPAGPNLPPLDLYDIKRYSGTNESKIKQANERYSPITLLCYQRAQKVPVSGK